MLKKRINTEIFRKYTIKNKSGNDVDMTNAYDIILYIQRQGSSQLLKEDFTRAGNVLSFQFSSEENNHIGLFDIHVEWKNPNINSEIGYNQEHADKTSDFEIVKSTEQEEDDDATSVLTSQTQYKDGASAFAIWKSKYGTETSTEDDFLAWLREPITSLQTEFQDGVLTIKN